MVKSLSKKAARSRHRRGATVFVVVMAVTLLAAVGLFAAHSATLVDQAAGYQRLSRQTQQLAEYGTLAAAAELSSGTAKAYIDQMRSYDAGRPACYANASLKDAPCYKLMYADLNRRVQELSNETLIQNAVGDTPDLVGNSNVQGDFAVEMTEVGPVGVPIAGTNLSGTSDNHFRYVQVTTTTIAQLRPASDACDKNAATLSGQQALRAHLIVGPIQE